MKKRLLSASILSADFGRLAEEVRAVEKAGTDWIHIDVMDGLFVPNITIGPDVVAALDRVTGLPLDVHLMIENPDRYLDAFAKAGADWLCVHAEACRHLHRTIQHMREDLHVRPAVALNPATPLSAVECVIGDVDMIEIMTVNPGFGGQKFIRSTLPKIRRLREMIDAQDHPVLIQVDGGVNRNTIDELVDAGVDVFVAGSAVFNGNDYGAAVGALKERMEM